MAEQIFPVVENTVVTIKVAGDLQLEGWDRPQGSALTDNHSTLKVHVEEPNVTVYCTDDCMISLPVGTEVVVERVGGDACVRGLTGKVQMRKVGGDLALQKSGSSEVLTVGGDCLIEEVQGALRLSKIGGDLMARDVQSELFAVSVGGDVELKNASGAVSLRAGGDISASLSAAEICNVELHAGGDIDLRLPQGAGAALTLTSRCHDIRVKLGELDNRYENSRAVISVGDERFKVVAEASGDLLVTDEPWNADVDSGFDEEFEDLDRDWADAEEIREKIGRLPDEIERRVNQKVQDAMRRAEPRIEEAMRRVQEIKTSVPSIPPIPPIPSIPPIPPIPTMPSAPAEPAAKTGAKVSNEERLLILQMLQEKKISPEEADRLLETLENLS